jgi:hypothetical protein
VNECHVEMIKWKKLIYRGQKNGDEKLGFFISIDPINFDVSYYCIGDTSVSSYFISLGCIDTKN